MKGFMEKNRTKIIVIVAVLILAASGIWGYNSYTNNGLFEKFWKFNKQTTQQNELVLQNFPKKISDPFVDGISPKQLETVDTIFDLVFKYIDKILSSLATLFGLFVLYKEIKKGKRKT